MCLMDGWMAGWVGGWRGGREGTRAEYWGLGGVSAGIDLIQIYTS